MAYVPESRIDRELAKMTQVPVPYHTVEDFPYNELGNRKFELLMYALFRRGIDSGWFRDEFDQVEMMPSPVGAGRVIVLLFKKKVRGAVIYRQRAGNVTVPSLAREVIAFGLARSLSDGLKFDPSGFKLFFAVSGGINPATLELVEDFNARIARESRLRYWAAEVIETNLHLIHLALDETQADLEDFLQRVDLEIILPIHLDRRLRQAPRHPEPLLRRGDGHDRTGPQEDRQRVSPQGT